MAERIKYRVKITLGKEEDAFVVGEFYGDEDLRRVFSFIMSEFRDIRRKRTGNHLQVRAYVYKDDIYITLAAMHLYFLKDLDYICMFNTNQAKDPYVIIWERGKEA